MSEEQRIYDFGDYVTSSEELAEIFYGLKKMAAALDFSDNTPADSLIEKQTAVSGCVSRMKHSLSDFAKRVYHCGLEDIPPETYAGKIIQTLDGIKRKTFYFKETALQLPADKIKSNLREAARLADSLPAMVAALDAGEDEVE